MYLSTLAVITELLIVVSICYNQNVILNNFICLNSHKVITDCCIYLSNHNVISNYYIYSSDFNKIAN